MSFTKWATRLSIVRIEYTDASRGRTVKEFHNCPKAAKKFYMEQDSLGNNPKIVSAKQ